MLFIINCKYDIWSYLFHQFYHQYIINCSIIKEQQGRNIKKIIYDDAAGFLLDSDGDTQLCYTDSMDSIIAEAEIYRSNSCCSYITDRFYIIYEKIC